MTESRFEPRSIFRVSVLTTTLSQRDTSGGPFRSDTWLPATSYQNHFAHGLYPLYKNPTNRLCNFPSLTFQVKEDLGQPISYPSFIWEPGPPPIRTQPNSGDCGNNPLQGTPPPENPQLLPQPRQGWSRVSVTSRETCQRSGQESNSEHLRFQTINNISHVPHAKSSLTPLTTCVTTTVIIPISQMRRQSQETQGHTVAGLGFQPQTVWLQTLSSKPGVRKLVLGRAQ